MHDIADNVTALLDSVFLGCQENHSEQLNRCGDICCLESIPVADVISECAKGTLHELTE